MVDDPIDACPYLVLLREIHGLEKLHYLFERQSHTPGSMPEWTYAVAAVRDRLTWCRQIASGADPALLGRALARLHDEIATPDPGTLTLPAAGSVPTGSLVH